MTGSDGVLRIPAPEPPLPPAAMARLERALEQHKAGQLSAAAQDYQVLLAENPGNSAVLQLTGCLLKQSGKPEIALPYFKAAISLSPNLWPILFNAANSFRDCQHQEDAVECYYRCLQIAPYFTDAADALTELCFSLGSRQHHPQGLELACQWQELGLVLRPDVAEIHADYAMALQLRGELVRACAHYAWAMLLDPAMSRYENNYIAAMIQRGLRAEVVQTFKDTAVRLWQAEGPDARSSSPAPPHSPLEVLPQAYPAGSMAMAAPVFLSPDEARLFYRTCARQEIPVNTCIYSGYPHARILKLQNVWCGGKHALVGDAAGNLVLSVYPDDLWVQSRQELIADAAQGATSRREWAETHRSHETPTIPEAGDAETGAATGKPGQEVFLYACSPWHWNYYHYLTEAVPRLLLTLEACPFLRSDTLRIITPVDRPFQQQVLALLGIPAWQILPADGQWRHYPELTVLENFQNTMAMRPEAVRCLRNALIPAALPEGRPQPWRRLYISRLDSTRKIVNESTLFAQLKPLGFQQIVCSDYSVAEQIRLFAEAAIVVGAHGANLTNILFMAAGTTVLEMMERGYVTQPYWTIASHSALNYAVLLCDDADPDNPDCRNRDMQVPVPALLSLLSGLMTDLPATASTPPPPETHAPEQ